MGFIVGLMLGAAMSGDSSSMPMLGSIPLRCLHAFDISEAEYRECRAPSLHAELWGGGICSAGSREAAEGACSTRKHITWEIAALRELKKASEKRQAAR